MATHREIRNRKNEIALAFESGSSLAEIRQRFGITDDYLRQCLSSAGLKRLRELRLEERRRGRTEQNIQSKSTSDEFEVTSASWSRDQQIVELAKSGQTLQSIGDQFSISRERVRQILTRENVSTIEIRKTNTLGREQSALHLEKHVELMVRKFPGLVAQEIAAVVSNEDGHLPWAIQRHRLLVLPTLAAPQRNPSLAYEKAVRALREAAQYSNPLTGGRYETLRKDGHIDGLSHIRIVQLLGSWSNACSEAGVEPGKSGRKSAYIRNFSDDEILENIVAFLLDEDERAGNGSVRSFDGWRTQRPEGVLGPSSSAVRWRIDQSWENARILALQRERTRWYSSNILKEMRQILSSQETFTTE